METEVKTTAKAITIIGLYLEIKVEGEMVIARDRMSKKIEVDFIFHD